MSFAFPAFTDNFGQHVRIRGIILTLTPQQGTLEIRSPRSLSHLRPVFQCHKNDPELYRQLNSAYKKVKPICGLLVRDETECIAVDIEPVCSSAPPPPRQSLGQRLRSLFRHLR